MCRAYRPSVHAAETRGPRPTRMKHMNEMFLEKFRALVPKYLEDPWKPEDGISEKELEEALEEHAFTVPQVLREFYLALGNSELMEAYHYFWDPEELEIDDEGFLMFLEDEDEQFTWGFRAGDLRVPDPIVYRKNNARGEWVSEDGTFSEFTFDMFEWVFSEDDEEDEEG
ncbi:hypothetical protein GCM10007172_21200 [Sinomonas atrocyanea]|nr:hypothetical protein GCM10007172_21200 [Sinomonas atrocyanea]